LRIALMADIHANREAFEACLRDARARGAEQTVLLGDYVGYGPDPVWVVDRIMELVEGGALAVLGNHDLGISESRESMNVDAETAMAWTRGQLGPAAREFLSRLPMKVEDQTRLYVHANVQADRRWTYIDGREPASRSFSTSAAQAVFCGHVHKPALYGLNATGKLVAFQPVAGVAVPLPMHRRWLSVLGSVGQPRDRDPASAYALLDTSRNELTFLRVPYDVEATAEKLRVAGLPDALAVRLRKGD
jgi:diadenosine tetraphosphatase ApaH/serine/threonine PP2A family protein phosphatase